MSRWRDSRAVTYVLRSRDAAWSSVSRIQGDEVVAGLGCGTAPPFDAGGVDPESRHLFGELRRRCPAPGSLHVSVLVPVPAVHQPVANAQEKASTRPDSRSPADAHSSKASSAGSSNPVRSAPIDHSNVHSGHEDSLGWQEVPGRSLD
jgi:hypothetical protein